MKNKQDKLNGEEVRCSGRKKTERVQTNISHTHLKRLKSTNFSDSRLSPSGIFVLLINMMVQNLGYSCRSTLYIGRMSVNVISHLKSTNNYLSHSLEKALFQDFHSFDLGASKFFFIGHGVRKKGIKTAFLRHLTMR